MKKLFAKIKGESGQAMVIVAAAVIVIFGATAFSVDLGMAYNAKAELQAAADAAALAGAQDMPKPFDNPPSYEKAINTAKSYAVLNGVEIDKVEVEAPYNYDRKLIEVTCSREFEYLFARVLGFDSKTITARAVAERRLVWGGETLPFMNIDDPYVVNTPSQIVLWENTGTGDFESLFSVNDTITTERVAQKDEFEFDGKGSEVTRCWLNGLNDQDNTPAETNAINLQDGVDASITTEIKTLINMWDDGEFIYILSLATIDNGVSNYINGGSVDNGNANVTSATIPLQNIVLLRCTITQATYNGNDRGIVLQYDGSAPINLGTAVQQGTYIPGFVNHDVRIKLVE